MRDEQVRRYARHVLLPDVGGLGQTALLVSAARVDVSQPAGMIAASYLAAGGVGTIVAEHAGEPELTALRSFNPDAKIVVDAPAETRPKIVVDAPAEPRPTPVDLDAKPPWWPLAGDTTALDFWRGSIAAVQYMAATIAKR